MLQLVNLVEWMDLWPELWKGQFFFFTYIFSFLSIRHLLCFCLRQQNASKLQPIFRHQKRMCRTKIWILTTFHKDNLLIAHEVSHIQAEQLLTGS